PAIGFTQDGGTRPRVLSLWGSPFHGTSLKIGKRVRRLNAALVSNYGHAGPRFVRHLLKCRSRWPTMPDTYAAWGRVYEKRAGDNPVAIRMATSFAAITVAEAFAHMVFELPGQCYAPIEPLWHELTAESGEADRAAVALRYLMGWAYAHQRDFYLRGN